MARSVTEAANAALERVCGYPVIGLLVRAGIKGAKDSAKDMAASAALYGRSLMTLIGTAST